MPAKKSASRKTLGKRAAPARKPERKETPLQLTAADRARIQAVARRTGLTGREVLDGALSRYAALSDQLEPAGPSSEAEARRPAAGRRLFLSVDGRPEIEVPPGEFVLGSGPDADLRLDLPLISPRHARVLWKRNQPVFEDLRSTRGSYRLGQPVDVHPVQDGDEIDLGGFLSVRFRLA